MVATTGPNLGVSQGWTTGEDDWGTLMNANMNLFDTVIHMAVKQVLSIPPTSPTAGDRYIVGASPTGAFIGHANEIAVRRNSTWAFYTPKAGWRVVVTTAAEVNRYREYDGTAWILEQSIAPTNYDKATAARLYVGGFQTTPQPAQYRRFVRFNGVDQYVDFGALPEVAALGDSQTIWGRMRLASSASGSDAENRPTLFSGHVSPQLRYDVISSASRVSAYYERSTGASMNLAFSSIPVPLNEFHTTAIMLRIITAAPTFREVICFVDETPTASGSTGTNSAGTVKMAANFSGASYYDGTTRKRFMNGDIESLAIWSRGLTDAEMAELAAGVDPTIIPDLVSYWDFEEGTGTTINNQVAGGGAGTLVGSPEWMEEGAEAAWIVGVGATGEWAGQDGKLAVATNGEWAFYSLRTGMEVFDSSSGITYIVTMTGDVASFEAAPAYVTEAPEDGQVYGRKDAGWEIVNGGELVLRQQWTRPWRGASVSLTTPPGAFTIPGMIAWDTENLDTESAWSAGTPMRITVPAGVTKVRLRAGVITSGSAVAGQLYCTFQKNTEVGATAGSFNPDGFRQSSTGFTGNTANIESPVLSVVEGDYFCVRINSSGLGAIIPQAGSYFEMEVVEAVGAVDDYPIDLAVFIHQKPEASEVVMQTVFTRAVDFAINFTGSKAKATTGATGTAPFQIMKNGVAVGVLSFAAAATEATFSGAVVSFAVGDVLSVVAPASQDATLADIALTFTGTRSL
jgi:hypothetical protein